MKRGAVFLYTTLLVLLFFLDESSRMITAATPGEATINGIVIDGA